MMFHWRREGEIIPDGWTFGWYRGPILFYQKRLSETKVRRIRIRWRWKFWLYRPIWTSLIFSCDEFEENFIIGR